MSKTISFTVVELIESE
ncbi:MAG: hypothetical protein ACTSRC_16415 [Candidatus Helarchaeota archaeon]